MFNKICGILTIFFIGLTIGMLIDTRKESVDVQVGKVSHVGFEWVGKDDGINGHTDHYWVLLAGDGDPSKRKYECCKEDYKILCSVSSDQKCEFYVHRRLFDSSYKYVQLKRIVK